jgi:SAM-dependent methyltransferase
LSEPLFDYQRYLVAKRTVDARAFNMHVWEALETALAAFPRPLRVLELGAGVGSMAVRFLERGLLRNADYTLVDQVPENLTVAEDSLKAADPKLTRFRFVSKDIYSFLESKRNETWDLLIGHALLDLLDIKSAIPRLLASLSPGGVFYFPINYDGLSTFQPEVDTDFETKLMAAYHRTMDERVINGKASGDSQTGRHLLTALPAAGGQVMAAGSSDWVVRRQGPTYPADEAYFLECILLTIEGALKDFPGLDQNKLNEWMKVRRAQLANSELTFIAHQLDVVGILPRVE